MIAPTPFLKVRASTKITKRSAKLPRGSCRTRWRDLQFRCSRKPERISRIRRENLLFRRRQGHPRSKAMLPTERAAAPKSKGIRRASRAEPEAGSLIRRCRTSPGASKARRWPIQTIARNNPRSEKVPALTVNLRNRESSSGPKAEERPLIAWYDTVRYASDSSSSRMLLPT